MKVIDCDFSSLEGSRCYCSPESAAAMRMRIAGLPLHAVHLLGSGDYHYVSLFWLERMETPFNLLLLDNHPDDQPPAFGDVLLSCGSWVEQARRLPALRGFRWIRREEDFSAPLFPDDLPVYLSVDLDVLSPQYARTNWDQGEMGLDRLESIIRSCLRNLAGADICGGISPRQGGSEDDMALNEATTERLKNVFRNETSFR